MSFATARQMWVHARPRLAGRWSKIETIHPLGFPDWYGFVSGNVKFIEAKANGDNLRPAQVAWIETALADGIDVYILAARGSRLAWYRTPDMRVEILPPSFYRP
jgi:hypothetical protein